MAFSLLRSASRVSALCWFYLGGLCAGCASASPLTPADDAGRDAAVADMSAPVDLLTPRDSSSPSALQDLLAPPDLTLPADLASPPDLGPFPPGAVFQISCKATGQLLSIHNSATTNGAITEEQPAHGTPDQRWLVRAETATSYDIFNEQSQSCLDVNAGSTADGATTWIWSCSGAASQLWTLQDAGSGFYNLVNVNSQSCLDVDHGNSAAGTVIFQYHCNGGDNQKWFFTRVQ
jgi:hypothetical protein